MIDRNANFIEKDSQWYSYRFSYVHGLIPPGGHSLVMGYWGCAAEWGRIFTTRLTIMELPFQAFSIELLEWGRTFSGL